MAVAWRPLEPGAIAIAHISDPHFGSPRAPEVWNHVATFLTGTLKPKLLLVTGDLVHTPEEELYERAKQALDGLRLQYFVCSGNHDRHVLGNRLDRKILFESPLAKRVMRRAQWTIMALGMFVAALIGACVGLLLGWWIGLSASLIAVLGGWFLVRYLSGFPERLVERFDPGHTSALFDAKFAGHLLSCEETKPVPLVNGAGEWKAGLLALESSRDVDCFARGHVGTTQLLHLTTATQGNQVGGARAEFDLCILMVHHHLLPVRLLEADREGNANDFVNATCLVNTGTLLEKLAEARVDLVLHGHEHKHNWGTYGSLENGFGPVRIVAAGSATGNDSFEGCQEKDATFNVLILAPDQSVRLRRMVLDGGSWKQDTETDLILFTPEELRQSRLRRRALIDTGDTRAEYKSEITKYVLFTRERDIQVYWLLTDWWLEKPLFEHPVINSTGVPVRPEVVLSADGPPEKVKAYFVPKQGQDHTWTLSFRVPPEFHRKRVRITVNYTWQGGGLLTGEELQAMGRGRALGTLRNEGFEFATIWTHGQPVSALELHLSVPPEYAPPPGAVKVQVDQSGIRFDAEAAALQKQLRSLATGRYSLHIPYPRIDRDYTLIWKPVDEKKVAQELKNTDFAARFAEVARLRGLKLLRAFGLALRGTPFWGKASLALYVKSADSLRAECVAQLPPSSTDIPSFPRPPESVDLKNEQNRLVQGWWGIPVSEARPDSEQQAMDFGFMSGEFGLVCVPIRFSLSATNPPPWGVVRIGVAVEVIVNLPYRTDDGTIWCVLSTAATRLLVRFLREEFQRNVT